MANSLADMEENWRLGLDSGRGAGQWRQLISRHPACVLVVLEEIKGDSRVMIGTVTGWFTDYPPDRNPEKGTNFIFPSEDRFFAVMDILIRETQ